MSAYVYTISYGKMLNEAMISNRYGIVRPAPKFSKLEHFQAAELRAQPVTWFVGVALPYQG
jgi:hypothetical protein